MELEDWSRRGRPAPQAELLDVSGHSVSTADFLGRETVLLFWDSNSRECAPLQSPIHAWEEDGDAAESPQLVIVVPGHEEGNQILDFRSPILIDAHSKAAEAYGVRDTPAAVAIHADGTMGAGPVTGGEKVSRYSTRWPIAIWMLVRRQANVDLDFGSTERCGWGGASDAGETSFEQRSDWGIG